MAGFVQWNFDPRKPDRIPPELDGVMVSRGILPDAVLLAFRTDTDLSLRRTNRYYLATKDHLYMVEGYAKIQKLTRVKGRKQRYGVRAAHAPRDLRRTRPVRCRSGGSQARSGRSGVQSL